MARIDIVVPVYNEARNIVPMLSALVARVRTPFRVLICYDFDGDDTLPAVESHPDRARLEVVLVKNPSRGPHAAVRAGLAASTADAVLVYMGDDDYNAGLVDAMYARLCRGADVVAASRFVPGGTMENCSSAVKEVITRLGTVMLYRVARLGVHDGTNAFRMFSRRLIDTVEIESRVGFTFSLELLVKAVRLGWAVDEVPALWKERADKPSRFRVFTWLPAYLRWLLYALATTWLGRGPDTVRRRAPVPLPRSASPTV